MSTRRLVSAGLVLSLLVAGVLSLVASSHPDGLEFVAGALADYAVRGVDGGLSGGLAGILGVLIVAALSFGLFFALRRRATRS